MGQRVGAAIEAALRSRPRAVLTVAILLLVGLPALRVITDQSAYMLFSAVPIVVLGMVYGLLGGLVSALISSVAYLWWATTGGESSTAQEAGTPFAFFTLGLISGVYAGGAMGGLDLRSSTARAELRKSIRQGRIVFHYQPIATAADGDVVALEALARWDHPKLGLLPPAEFIELAEGHEATMWELTMCGLDTALAETARLRSNGGRMPVAVNVSKVILHRPDLVREISAAMSRHSCPAGGLTIEVTEKALSANPVPTARTLAQLGNLGVATALDDFGTGYSSLAELGRLPVKTLKLDLGVFAEWAPVGRRHAIHGIAEVAHALDIAVVIERVEDAVLWELARESGCDLVQGNEIGPPLPIEKVSARLD